MESKIGTNPPLIWRSILLAQDTLHEGMIWKIGDGRTIEIWEDKRLQCIPRQKPNGPDVKFVRELIDENRSWWNESIINGAFDAEIARVLKQMVLGNLNCPDRVRWNETSTGEYSVSSAYALELRRQKAKEEGEALDAEESKGMWRRIWKLKISETQHLHRRVSVGNKVLNGGAVQRRAGGLGGVIVVHLELP
ncbi:to reverse trancriptase, related [Cinnamomum micranthum f. kanehirae]|uniref:To reverse trancriptase, related n=1 Tax=Cinnamomum micranthum f. kanehirae TaxID=337451 RepID=A0A443NFJ8_9MAGN|nr:to reverse trancriptase, related [Cinnamomum micranthum f. kanehirae]